MRRDNVRTWAWGALWLVILLLGGRAWAGDTYWQHDPATAGDWFVPANWTAGLPTGDDNAYVDNAGTAQIAASLAEAHELYVGHAAGTSGAIELSGGDVASGSLWIGYYGTGHFIQTGGTNTVEVRLYLAVGEGSSGTYELSGGELRPGSQQSIGYRGTGIFRHSGGISTGRHLSVGHGEGSSGTYELSGTAQLSLRNASIGFSGTGLFRHSGGTNTVADSLTLGAAPRGEGTYDLSGDGQLSAAEQYIASAGTGLFRQTGGINTVEDHLYLGHEEGSSGTYELSGTAQLSAGNQYIGHNGAGLIRQSGGTNTVTGTIKLGYPLGSQGTYELGGDGQLSADDEYIGGDGMGLFIHTGGTNTVTGTLHLGMGLGLEGPGSQGTYQLSGDGQLSAAMESIGYSGSARFNQSGGTNSVAAALRVASHGTYELGGDGQLSADEEYVDGRFAHTGGANTVAGRINVGPLGTYELRGDGGLSADSEYLDGRFTQTGGMNTVCGSLALGEQGIYELSGDGELSAYKEHLGGRFTQAGGTNTVDNALYFGYGSGCHGRYELSGGELRLTGHPRATHTQYVGYYGTGLFIQTGGTNTIEGGLVVGRHEGSSGTYELSNGELTAGSESIGSFGAGLFIQTGGANTITHDLRLGRMAGSSGTFRLSAGDLRAERWEYVGWSGTGHFVQTGGTNTAVSGLCVGYDEGSSGTYELAGTGQLSTLHQVVGNEGTGRFIQTGGINEVRTSLYLGYGLFERVGEGTYELCGGQLRVMDSEYVGSSGTGHFIQTGGINDVSATLYLGWGLFEPTAQGTYELRGGDLRVFGSQYVGYYGTGLFAQTGGTNTVGDSLFLGRYEGSSGTYAISGGSLSTARLFVGLAGSGALSITGASADITVSQLLLFGRGSTFSAVAGSTIHMSGSTFYNSSTDPVALAGLANLRLIFEGGGGAFNPVEVAGEDLGPVPGGWTDNFAFGTLQLGGADAGRIQLVDGTDNQQDGPGNEALYVDWLILNAGAAIDFNALALYFLNGGPPKQLFAGDANLDGCVDGLDYVTWATNYGQSGKAWKDSDYNGDTVVDGLDYIAWCNNYLRGAPGGAGEPIPEPGAVALILAGACLILPRRRV